MGEIHELLVLALSLVWFAGATPDSTKTDSKSTLSKILTGSLLLNRGVCG